MQKLDTDNTTLDDLLFMLENDDVIWAKLNKNYEQHLTRYSDNDVCNIVAGQEGKYGRLAFCGVDPTSIAIRFYSEAMEHSSEVLQFVGTMHFNNIHAFTDIIYEDLPENPIRSSYSV